MRLRSGARESILPFSLKTISPFFIILDQDEMLLAADQEHLDFIMSEYALESYSAYDSDGYGLVIRLDHAAFPSTFTVKREDRTADLDGLCKKMIWDMRNRSQ